MKRCIIVITEGETERIFYKSLISTNCSRGVAETHYKKVDGIGNFYHQRNKIIRTIKQHKINDKEIIVLLCYDEDVFNEQSGGGIKRTPPPDPALLANQLQSAGADKVFYLKPPHTVEDWIMLDKRGVLHFLKISSKTKCKGRTGLEKLRYLYKIKDKSYTKNSNDTQKLVNALDMNIVLRGLPSEILELLNSIFN